MVVRRRVAILGIPGHRDRIILRRVALVLIVWRKLEIVHIVTQEDVKADENCQEETYHEGDRVGTNGTRETFFQSHYFYYKTKTQIMH